MTSKKGITIKRTLREKIYEYSSFDETIEEALIRLIDEAGDISDEFPPSSGSTTFKISQETYDKLVSLKHKPSDSYSSVIERLFQKIEK